MSLSTVLSVPKIFLKLTDFYLSTLEEIETGQGSWKDQQYWMTQMVLLTIVLRSAPPARQPTLGGGSENLNNSTIAFQPQDCHQLNIDVFSTDHSGTDSPDPNNDPTRSHEVHCFCEICLRNNLKKGHAAEACKEGSPGQWLAYPSGDDRDALDASEHISDTEVIIKFQTFLVATILGIFLQEKI